MKKERKLFNWLTITLTVIVIVLLAAMITFITLAIQTANNVINEVSETQINWQEQWDAFANKNPKLAIQIAMFINMIKNGIFPWN